MEGGFFEVLFRESNASVSWKVRPGKNGKYTLTLELTSAGKAGDASSQPKTATNTESKSNSAGKAGEKPLSLEAKKVETSDLFGSRIAQQIRGAVPGMLSKTDGGSPRPTWPDSKSQAFVEPDENVLGLYASANEKFESCSRNLVFCAPEIIESYEEALKGGPRSSQAPLAIYRTALAHVIMGSHAKADKLFRLVTSQWPDHPVASRCWVGIGDIYNKKQAYMEAMEAFRTALRAATQSEDKAAAYFELGKVFLVLGVNKEALEMLNNSISQQPDYYLKKPDVYRFIGEAYFGLGNVEKAKGPFAQICKPPAKCP